MQTPAGSITISHCLEHNRGAFNKTWWPKKNVQFVPQQLWHLWKEVVGAQRLTPLNPAFPCEYQLKITAERLLQVHSLVVHTGCCVIQDYVYIHGPRAPSNLLSVASFLCNVQTHKLKVFFLLKSFDLCRNPDGCQTILMCNSRGWKCVYCAHRALQMHFILHLFFEILRT